MDMAKLWLGYEQGDNKNSLAQLTSEIVVTVVGDNDSPFVCVAFNQTSDVMFSSRLSLL